MYFITWADKITCLSKTLSVWWILSSKYRVPIISSTPFHSIKRGCHLVIICYLILLLCNIMWFTCVHTSAALFNLWNEEDIHNISLCKLWSNAVYFLLYHSVPTNDLWFACHVSLLTVSGERYRGKQWVLIQLSTIIAHLTFLDEVFCENFHSVPLHSVPFQNRNGV